MITLQKLQLKDNPFKYITPEPKTFKVENPLWAGLDDIKRKITEIYSDLETTDAMNIILNWGPYGGGKTYAAYYFIYHSKANAQQNFIQIYVRSPKEGSSATNNLYRSIIDYLSFSQIKERISTLLEKVGGDELFKLINDKINSEDFATAIMLIGSNDKEVETIMHRYLYSNVTKTELKKVGLARTIDSEIDRIKILSGIFHCFIGDSVELPGRVILWIDEVEDLIYYSSKHYKIFSQALRDLVDTMNENFCMFLNFTLSEPEQDTIELVLGSALWTRITNKIRFSDLDKEGAKKYVKDLIKYYQIEDTGDYGPFSESAVDRLLEIVETTELTPREINKIFNNVLLHAQRNDFEHINNPVVEEWRSQFEQEES